MDTAHIAEDLLTQMYHNSKKGPAPVGAGGPTAPTVPGTPTVPTGTGAPMPPRQ
jgi:hypothetical protein